MKTIVWIVILLIILFLIYYWWKNRQEQKAAALRAEEQARQSAARKAALGTAAGAGVAAAAAGALKDAKSDAAGLAHRGAAVGDDVARGVRDAGRDVADAARDAGRDAGDVARDAGRGVRDVGRDAGDAARDAGRDVHDAARDTADAARRAGRDVGDAAYDVGRDTADGVRSLVDDTADALGDLKHRAADLLGGGADAARDAGRKVDAGARGIAHDASRAGDDLIGGAAGVWSESARSADESIDALRERAADLGAAGDTGGAASILDDLERRAAGLRAEAADAIDRVGGGHAWTEDEILPVVLPESDIEPVSAVRERAEILDEAADALSAADAQRHMTDIGLGAAGLAAAAGAAGERIRGFVPHTGDVPAGALVGTGSHDCPASHPIKGNEPSMVYHEPGGSLYERTIPELCFASTGAAEAAGFRPVRHGQGQGGEAAALVGAAAATTKEERMSEAKPYTGEVPAGAVAGDGTYTCPRGNPVKGNVPSMIYHLPGQMFYERTIAELCFTTARAAAKAGFRPIRTRSTGEAVIVLESEEMVDDVAASIAKRGKKSKMDELAAEVGAALGGDGAGGGAGGAGGAAGGGAGRGLTGESLAGLVDFEADVVSKSAGVKRCPKSHPIKGNLDSNLYHMPDGASYGLTIAEFCFATREAAEAAGFDAAKR